MIIAWLEQLHNAPESKGGFTTTTNKILLFFWNSV
jgi:hypothetical protein